MGAKGDLSAQRRSRRARYRGCRVCGVRGGCSACDLAKQIVAVNGYASLAVVVDGSFVHGSGRLGHGGAGLVLVRGEEVLDSRACGFQVSSSSDAELQAVIRGARWAPGVAIYTDSRDLPVKMVRVNPQLSVHYLEPSDRSEAHAQAHRLSVEGRCREAPETIPAVGIAVALERSQLTKAQRKARGAELLLKEARRDPHFDGDFTAIAERFGWTSGKLWRHNPVIRVATERWLAESAKPPTRESNDG